MAAAARTHAAEFGMDLGRRDMVAFGGAAVVADDYGLLVSDAVDSYRALLETVTLHPAMGLSLNMAGNRKAAPVLGTVPDAPDRPRVPRPEVT